MKRTTPAAPVAGPGADDTGRVTAEYREPRRRARWGWWVLGIVVVVGAWLGICAWRAAAAYHELRDAENQAQQLRAQLSPSELSAGGATEGLRSAAGKFRAAHASLSGALFAPLRVVPVVGRQLTSAIDLSSAAATVSTDGVGALDQLHALLNAPHATGPQRAAAASQLAGVVATLDRQVAAVHLGPVKGLVGSLADRHNTFATELAKLQGQLQRAQGASAAISGMLRGPATYLVFSANNAEMRAGSGMFLSVGTLTARGGELTLGDFTPTGDLYFPTPEVPLTGDLANLWAAAQPNQEFRNLALSPQFPANAALAAQMWKARTGQRVDGVLVLDAQALAQVLSATGPVSADGRTFDATSLVPYLLNGQYQGITTDEQQSVRHDRDGDLARAAVAAVTAGRGSLGDLVEGLDQAGNGRHILAWSSAPGTEAQWQAAGIGGVVGPRDLLLSVLNRGANKLDPYVAASAEMSFAPQGATTAVTVKVTVHNGAPAGQPPYVAGNAGTPPAPGTYVGYVQLNLPGSAGAITVAGNPKLRAAGPDGQSYAVAVPLQLRAGATTTVTYRFVLGAGHGPLAIEPSARLPATTWTVGSQRFTDATAHVVNW